jgi:protein SCO1/2
MNRRILVALSLVLAACSKAGAIDRQSAAEAASSRAADVTLLPADGPSLDAVNVDLVDQNGQRVALADFAGQPLIVTMFYSSCPYACPMLISKIQGAEAMFDAEARRRVNVLMVSFDTEHDTPEVLKAVAAQHRVDPRRWHLAHASDADVRTLAAVLGIRYKKVPEGGFSHSSVITVLDGRGVARFRQDDLNAPPDAVARAIALLGPSTRTALR